MQSSILTFACRKPALKQGCELTALGMLALLLAHCLQHTCEADAVLLRIVLAAAHQMAGTFQIASAERSGVSVV